jgi:hypothetical protein
VAVIEARVTVSCRGHWRLKASYHHNHLFIVTAVAVCQALNLAAIPAKAAALARAVRVQMVPWLVLLGLLTLPSAVHGSSNTVWVSVLTGAATPAAMCTPCTRQLLLQPCTHFASSTLCRGLAQCAAPHLTQVTCGSTIKLVHDASKSRLHAPEVQYSRGSQQNIATAVPQDDSGQSYWVVHGTLVSICTCALLMHTRAHVHRQCYTK